MLNLIISKTTTYLDKLVSFIILLIALRLVLYMLTNLFVVFQEMATGNIWLSGHDDEMLDWIVLYIVMVKAYKVLVSYARHHHISIRYVTELVIIACFVELIFEQHMSELFRALLGAVGISSLFLYLYFYQTFKELDEIKK